MPAPGLDKATLAGTAIKDWATMYLIEPIAG